MCVCVYHQLLNDTQDVMCMFLELGCDGWGQEFEVWDMGLHMLEL